MCFDFDIKEPENKPQKTIQKVKAKTVSEVSQEIKNFVEKAFNHIYVKGEIFGAKRADSGHWYLSLKDDNAILSAVCWRTTASSLKVKIEDGLEVIAKGKITTFAGKSSYQLVIESLELAGEGALLKLLEERKLKFIKEGLFDASHKLPIPFLPKTIGVVTSPTGAVIRDIIHRIKDRFPCHILVWPTPVQGEGSELKISEAIQGFNALPASGGIPRPDVIIVARGGGSLEDLWAFNEECVIRAVYNSTIPIISAVGHETDTMLIDFVSDRRAPTPTGAAEFAVPVRNELLFAVNTLDNRLKNSMRRYLDERKNWLEGLSRGIPNLIQIINENIQKLDYREERLNIAIKNLLTQKENALLLKEVKPIYIKNLIDRYNERIDALSHRLNGVSVETVLKRGYAWIKGDNNQIISTLKEAQNENNITIHFIDGEMKLSSKAPKNNSTENSNAPQKDGMLFDF